MGLFIISYEVFVADEEEVIHWVNLMDGVCLFCLVNRCFDCGRPNSNAGHCLHTTDEQVIHEGLRSTENNNR